MGKRLSWVVMRVTPKAELPTDAALPIFHDRTSADNFSKKGKFEVLPIEHEDSTEPPVIE